MLNDSTIKSTIRRIKRSIKNTLKLITVDQRLKLVVRSLVKLTIKLNIVNSVNEDISVSRKTKHTFDKLRMSHVWIVVISFPIM